MKKVGDCGGKLLYLQINPFYYIYFVKNKDFDRTFRNVRF